MAPPLIQHLRLRNYKSVASCDMPLEALTLLVGRNGAGKSNILDALHFTKDALDTTLEFAMRERGGINEVRCRSLRSRPRNFSIGMRVGLADGGTAIYMFRIAPVSGGGFSVAEEECVIQPSDGRGASFRVGDGIVESWTAPMAPPSSPRDRLALVRLSGYEAFRPLFDALTRMAFHNLSPEQMKRPQKPEAGDRLAHDGHNIASVLKHLKSESPSTIGRVVRYLNAIGVEISNVSHKQVGSFETIQVEQRLAEVSKRWEFDALSMSDGTMRALGILVSLLSANGAGSSGPTLVGVEEPESALHPAAVGALVDALLEGVASTQVVLTCHSPDLLDHPSIAPEMIRVVEAQEGQTRVARLSSVKTDLLRNHLSTAGELLRLDQLTPDDADLRRQQNTPASLFDEAV